MFHHILRAQFGFQKTFYHVNNIVKYEFKLLKIHFQYIIYCCIYLLLQKLLKPFRYILFIRE